MPKDKYDNYIPENFDDIIDNISCDINKHELKLVILELDIVKAHDLISSINEISRKEQICLRETKRMLELTRKQKQHFKKYGHINLEINE